MFTTPQKRRGASKIFSSPSTSVPLTKGLFSDGVWNCNCSPRLPATHFLVKKEGRNKGRWFYTCQTNREDGGCGFFIWEEEAKTREGKTVIGNSRSEREVAATKDGYGRIPPKVSVTPDGDARRIDLAGKANATVPQKLEGGNSRSSSDEFGEWLLSPGTVEKAVKNTEIRYSSPPWPDTQPETPRKAARTSPFTTPSSKRKRDEIYFGEAIADGLPTPVTDRRARNASEYGYNDSDPFSTPSSLRTPSQFGIRSPSQTPTPNITHVRRPTSPLEDIRQAGPPNSYDFTTEVLTLLQEERVYLDEGTENKLKALLGKHAMRVSGIAKGRDITRVALRSKDAKIAELGLKIGHLEAEREVDKRVIKSLTGNNRER